MADDKGSSARDRQELIQNVLLETADITDEALDADLAGSSDDYRTDTADGKKAARMMVRFHIYQRRRGMSAETLRKLYDEANVEAEVQISLRSGKNPSTWVVNQDDEKLHLSNKQLQELTE